MREARTGIGESEAGARLSLLVEHAPIGIGFLDRDLRYLEVNDRLAEINGLPAEAHLGHTVAEVLPGVAPLVIPLLRSVLDSGIATLDQEIVGTTPAAPGVERAWSASYYPVPATDGTVTGIGLIVREVTEERRLAVEREAAERQFRTTIERVTDGFVALDRDWRYIYVNSVAAELLGRDPAQLVGRHIWTEFPEGVGQPFHLAYERAMAEQRTVTFEDYYEPWDRFFENRVYPSPEGVTIFFSEVTERRRAERELARNRARFDVIHRVERAILEAGTPTDIGPEALAATRAVLGGDAAALARYDAVAGTVTMVTVDGVHVAGFVAGAAFPLDAAHAETLAGGRVTLAEDLAVEDPLAPLPHLRDAGVRTLLTVPLRFGRELVGLLAVGWLAVTPVSAERVDTARQVAATVAIALRQASLYEAEHQARTAAEAATTRMEALQSVTDLGMAALPVDALLEHLTARAKAALVADGAAILLATPGDGLETAATSGPEAATPEARLAMSRFAERVARRRRTLVEQAGGDPDAGWEPAALVGTPLLVDDRSVGVLVVGSVRPRRFDEGERSLLELVADRAARAIERARMTEAIAAHAHELEVRVAERTARLTEINEELDAFSYTVSHDLRAPLRSMQGFATALLEDEGDRLSPDGAAHARRITMAAARMDALISDLLAYGRLGRTDLRPTPVGLAVSVAGALRDLEAVARERGARIEVEDPLGAVMAHPPTLRQAIANLVGNAIKFSAGEEPPRVTIRAEGAGGQRRLWVEDRGIGVAPEHRDRIFRVFERLHGLEAFPGTGIGLAMVRRTVQRQGGSCGVEGRPGGGSRFWIELPDAGPEVHG